MSRIKPFQRKINIKIINEASVFSFSSWVFQTVSVVYTITGHLTLNQPHLKGSKATRTE